ncbi:MAG: hypothetical protein DSM106950_08375 [Stigonema ocellatum SAG 48.90 = DSM 106950]|nr:hypothetical protein [Stigonema ocellatum SAG 48.90 = DSM 106950]
MQKRCDRNRKRPKRRSIYCPIHGCHLDSVSQKYSLFADRAGQLRERGMSRQNALMLVAAKTAVSLAGEWLEAFWCDQCQATKWYHVQKRDNQTYYVTVAPMELWQQAIGVIDPKGNPSVGEFTRTQAKMVSYQGGDFQFLG